MRFTSGIKSTELWPKCNNKWEIFYNFLSVQKYFRRYHHQSCSSTLCAVAKYSNFISIPDLALKCLLVWSLAVTPNQTIDDWQLSLAVTDWLTIDNGFFFSKIKFLFYRSSQIINLNTCRGSKMKFQKLRLCWRSAAMLGATMWPFLVSIFIVMICLWWWWWRWWWWWWWCWACGNRDNDGVVDWDDRREIETCPADTSPLSLEILTLDLSNVARRAISYLL